MRIPTFALLGALLTAPSLAQAADCTFAWFGKRYHATLIVQGPVVDYALSSITGVRNNGTNVTVFTAGGTITIPGTECANLDGVFDRALTVAARRNACLGVHKEGTFSGQDRNTYCDGAANLDG